MFSVEHATLVGGNHILDVDECVFTTVNLKAFESALNKVAKVLAFSLTVVDLVTEVDVLCLHKVEHWEDLPVVWNQSLANSVRALNKALQDFEGDCNDLWVTGVQGN